jgi:hypothetical protein
VTESAAADAGTTASASAKPNEPSTADPKRIAAALAVLPNDHEPLKGYAVTAGKELRRNDDQDIWRHTAEAIHRAIGGSGLALFQPWSRKSPKHNDDATEEMWSQITDSPFTAATIFYRANLENPRWPALIGNTIEVAIEINALSLLPVTQY